MKIAQQIFLLQNDFKTPYLSLDQIYSPCSKSDSLFSDICQPK